MTRVPVLMYHSISPRPEGAKRRSIFVHPNSFRRQMALLSRSGYRGISIGEAMPYLEGRESGKVCVLTFDDGFEDNLLVALPVLRRHGFTATCYLVSDHIGGSNSWSVCQLGVTSPLMNQVQVEQWLAAGMEIGAHTRTHPHLTTLDEREIRDQVEGSKQALEERFRLPVTQFCYPYGFYDDRVLAAVRASGFVAATTTVRGRARAPLDLLQIPRVHVLGYHWLFQFWLKLFTAYGDRP